jgi:hypothetical protein
MGRGGGSRSARGGGGGGASTAATPPPAPATTGAGVAGMDRLSTAERFAVDDYSTTHYSDMNNVARGKFVNPKYQAQIDAAKERIALVDAAIAKGTLARPATLYRGTNVDVLGGKLPAVGTTFSDKGFLSTSTSRGVAQSFQSASGGGVVLRIAAPRGARAVDVSHVSGGLEHEVLLPRNAKLRVTGVSASGGQTTIDVKLVR